MRKLNFLFSVATLFVFNANVLLSQPVTEAAPSDLNQSDAGMEQTASDTVLRNSAMVESIGNEDWQTENIAGRKDIHIVVGNSHLLQLDRAMTRIAISDPEVADAVVVNRREILISSKKRGSSNLLVWDRQGKIFIYTLIIVGDPVALKSALTSISPDNPVEVFSTEKGYVVSGNVDTVQVQKQIAETSKAFSADSISIVTVNEAKQILLEIQVVEVDRSKNSEFGIDGAYLAEKFGFTFMPGGLGPISAVVNDAGDRTVLGVPEEGVKALFTGTYSDPKRSVNTVIRALETQSLVKVISRPNILVRDGAEAKILVGGQFPIPQVTQTTTSVTYKEFGTKLTYTPTILPQEMIRFEIQTEVSELDSANGIQANGFSLPAITSRIANTTVEIKDKETLVIGGMISQRNTNIESGTPYLRKVPLLGKLFKNTDKQSNNVELVIMMTPHILDSTQRGAKMNGLQDESLISELKELPRPPFEDEKALAIEEALMRFENMPSEKPPVDSRAYERTELREKIEDKKNKKRAKKEARIEKKRVEQAAVTSQKPLFSKKDEIEKMKVETKENVVNAADESKVVVKDDVKWEIRG